MTFLQLTELLCFLVKKRKPFWAFSMCVIENEEWPSQCGRGMWRRVFFRSVSSLLSHLIGYRLTAGETQAVPSEQPHCTWDFFSPFSASFFVCVCLCTEKHSFSPMQISACGKYRDRVTFHPSVPSANQAPVGGERLPLFFLQNHYLLNTLCSVARI